MWYVFQPPKSKKLLYAASVLLITSCGQPSGNAPGGEALPAPTPGPAPVTSTETAIMKYGESVTTPGGWTISIDNSDPVESAPLANGWTVEVLGE